MLERIRYFWSRATAPVKAGLLFGALGGLFMGVILALLGWFRVRGDLRAYFSPSSSPSPPWESSPGPSPRPSTSRGGRRGLNAQKV